MSWAFFWIPAAHPNPAQDELNAFVRAHRVVAVEKQFVGDGANSAWAVAVEVVDAAAPSASTKGKLDYRDCPGVLVDGSTPVEDSPGSIFLQRGSL